jgi:hypothetical protein
MAFAEPRFVAEAERIAARSSAVKPFESSLIEVLLLGDFCVVGFACSLPP